MVLGFIKDKKFHPTENRSPIGQRLTSGRLLPKEESPEDQERRSKRIGKFALKKAKVFASKTRATGEKLKNIHIERSILARKETEDLDRDIDDILDDERKSDSSKFRLLQRFGLLNRSRLSKSQLKVVNDSLRELDERIRKRRKGETAGTGGMTISQEKSTFVPEPIPERTGGISAEEFAKLPESIKAQIRQISAS